MPRSPFGFLFSLLLLVGGLFGAEADETWIRGTFTGRSPRPQPMPETDAWRCAAEVAAQGRGAFVLVGQGRSMQPLYPAGTILVLQPVPFRDLQPGQTVLYRSRKNRAVAHVLVSKTRDGWRARGLNNATPDAEPVLEKNLVGVVIAAYSPGASAPSKVVARVHPSEAGAVYFDTRLR